MSVWAAVIGGLAGTLILTTVHPRMGTPLSSVESAALLEAPGFLMLNYGSTTPIVNLVVQARYGAIVAGFASPAD